MFWHNNIILRFQRFLLTWFMQFLYSLLKTFSSQVLTLESLIWVQMITLGLFWSLNEILVWIWSIILSLHFGKPKIPIFVPKWYTALIFVSKGYGHRKDYSWTQTQYFNVWRQKHCITVPKVSLTLFIRFLYSLLKTFASNILASKSLIWVQILTLGLFWSQNEIFVLIWSIKLSLQRLQITRMSS